MKNDYLLTVCLSAFLIVTAWSCQETTATPAVQLLDRYYPLTLNVPLYYRVDSIILVNEVGGVRYDTSYSQARETLVSTFTGADGREVYRGERWTRKDTTGPFVFNQTFTVERSNSQAIRTEDNLTFTKLVAPLRTGVEWDGNAAFDERRRVVVGGEFLDVYNGWDYRYGEVNSPATLPNGSILDSVVTVDQVNNLDEDPLLDLRIAYERYAAGIGLVERFIDARHTQCRICCGGDTNPCKPLPWDEKAEKGYIIHQVYQPR